MDDLIVFELPEKDPPSVDSFELLASNPEDQKEKKEPEKKNQDQNTNLIQLNKENQNDNKNSDNADSLSNQQNSQQLSLTNSSTRGKNGEIDSDSLLQIPSPADVLRGNILPTSKSTILDKTDKNEKLFDRPLTPQLSQHQSPLASRQQSQQISQQQSPLASQQPSQQNSQQQSQQNSQQQSPLISRQQSQQQSQQISRQQSQQQSQQISRQQSQQQSQQISRQQSQQISQQQSQQQSPLISRQQSQQQSQQISQQQSQQILRQQSQQISQQQSQQVSQQQSPKASQNQQHLSQLQSQQNSVQQPNQQKHVQIQEPNQPKSPDTNDLLILDHEDVKNENENKNENAELPHDGCANINISITLDHPVQLSPQEDNKNDYLIDFTEIPISNTPKTSTTNQEILDLQPTPQWVTVIQSYLTNLISLQLSIAIHRSKLFSLYDCFRDLQKNFKPDLTLDIPTLKQTCCNLIDSIKKARQIVYSCSASHWGQSAITWPSTTIKDSVKRLREEINECIVQFNCREPRPNFLISEKELEAQDSVDQLQLKGSLLEYLNRISEQEPQTQQMKQIAELIKDRLNSIGPVEGIQEGPALLHITPFLPSRLNLVLDKKDFVVCQKIGCGTFGSVFKGYMAKSQKPVAIKMLNAHLLGGRQLETFKREVWTMANLNHPSILHLVGVTLTAPFCIVTELLKCSLYDRLKFLSPTKRSVIALRVSQAMEQLHAARIIHRDLKSANILLDDDDMPRVCDFGLVGFKKRGTKTGYVGTAQWMAPEILRSSPFYDEKVDVYSFAVLLWEMLTQKQPYMNMTQDQMVMAIIEKGLRPEIGDGPEFGPPALISLIKKCWSEKPSDRPSFPQITTALFTPECHFIGTNEDEFMKLSSKQELSSMIVHAYDNCNWQKLDELMSLITPDECKEDPELINTVIALFPNLNKERKIYILENLPKFIDLESFLRSKGYSFIVSLFSQDNSTNHPEVINASVKMLRKIQLSSKSFRQVKLISYLSKCQNKDALQFLADLCEYEDVARQVSDHDIPFNIKNGLEMTILHIYKNLLNFPKLRQKVSQCLQPIHLMAITIHDNPTDTCECLTFYDFEMDHSKLIINIDLIPKIAEVSQSTPLALKLLSRIFSICSVDDLLEYKYLIHDLLEKNDQVFKEDDDIYSKLVAVDSNKNEPIKRNHSPVDANANVASSNSSSNQSTFTSTSSINSSPSPVSSAGINLDEHLIDPHPIISSEKSSTNEEEHLIDPHPVVSSQQNSLNEEEHLIDPHPIMSSEKSSTNEEEHLIDPHPIVSSEKDNANEEEHLIDPHPIMSSEKDNANEEEHLIDPHPVVIQKEEEHLIDPHPIQNQTSSNISDQEFVQLIEPVPLDNQFNTQPQYAQQQTINEPDGSTPSVQSYQNQDLK